KRPGRADVRYHRLGTDASSDRVVHEETGDPRTFLGVDMSWNGKWLIATVAHGWSRTDVFYRKREATSADWKPLVVGNDATYDVRAWGGHFYIRTDEGSSNYRLFRVPVSSPERSNWKEIIPEKKDAVLDGFSVVGGRLAVKYLVDARSRLAIYRPDGRRVRRVKLPGTGYASGISGTPDRKKGYFSYQSFETPEKIMRVSVEQPGTDVWKGTEVPVDPTNFRVKQVWYESKDGTEVSMYLVLPKGAADEGPIPFLMYGYGGFKVSLQPYFVEGVIPWLRAGGGYAMPNLRGGGEYGEKWHRAGMLKKKQNTFDDFIAAGEYLTENGYTRSDELTIWGASNGG
ncbi:MAG: prolyl oligopeptidase family serine peptidase, partial [Bradymonadaceae bacterium]